MIVKIPPKKGNSSSFRRLIEYISQGHGKEQTLYTGSRNILIGSGIRNYITEMEAVAAMNVRCKDPVFHAIISWKEGEIPTSQQMEEAVDVLLKEMGLTQNQVYFGAHQNTQNIHLHICVCRIDPDTLLAVKPALGWTHKASVRAARKIEILQGWSVDQGGGYIVDEEGRILEESADKKIKSISMKAQDFENRTGAKSAERIAKEQAAEILFNAPTWTALHQQLSEKGFKLERKGSGAILFIGEQPVKVSSVSQKLSLKKLEARLGAYQLAPEDTLSSEPQISTEHVEPLQKSTDLQTYLRQRQQYYADKRKAQQDFRDQCAMERKALKEKQKVERETVFHSRPWKGHGDVLNAVRSLQAAQHVGEKEALYEQQQKRRKDLRELFLQRFPSYEEWLREQGKILEAERWRYRQRLPGILSGAEYVLPERKNIGTFTGHSKSVLGKLIVDFVDDSNGKTAFTDYGKKIVLHDKELDREAVKAAMKLAAQKWGQVSISGDDAYKDMCVDVAAELGGITLKNVDLQRRVEEQRKRLKQQQREGRDLKEMQEFERYHSSVGADRYRVTAIAMAADGTKKAWILDKAGGKSQGFSPDVLRSKMRWLHFLETAQHRNIYYTPISDTVHHILIDDVKPAKLKQLIDDGYEPCLAIRSSPGNFQVILNVPKSGTEFDRQLIAALTRKLNQEYGDPKLCGAIHPHRAPGFHNLKPKHQQPDGTFPEAEVEIRAAAKRECTKCQEVMAQMLREYQRQQREAEQETRQYNPTGSQLPPLDAYLCHAKNIMQRYPDPNWNQVDSQIAVRMAVTGYSQAQIRAAIQAGAPAIRPESKKHSHNWPSYAAMTARFPWTTMRGQIQRERYQHLKDLWLRIEGRGSLLEQNRRQSCDDIVQKRRIHGLER